MCELANADMAPHRCTAQGSSIDTLECQAQQPLCVQAL